MNVNTVTVVVSMLVSVFLCSCVSQETTVSEEQNGENVLDIKIPSVERIGEYLFDFLDTPAGQGQVYFWCSRWNGDGVGGSVSSYFELDGCVHTNHLFYARTLYLSPEYLSPGMDSILLRKLHPSIEALDLLGNYDIRELGCCPNVKYLNLRFEDQFPEETLNRIAMQFPNIEALSVNDNGDEVMNVVDLSFVKYLPRLRILVYCSSAPIRNLAESLEKMLTMGNLSCLSMEISYRRDDKHKDLAYKYTGCNDPVRAEVQSRKFLIPYVDAYELLKSTRCKSVVLFCTNVIPCNLWALEHIEEIKLYLKINSLENREVRVEIE